MLRDAGCPWIAGYKPLGNYQQSLSDTVDLLLLDDTLFDQAAMAAVSQPAVTPMALNFARLLDEPPAAGEVRETPATYNFTPVQRDYVAREARNRALGLAGEELVLHYERIRLQRLGHTRLSERVEHVARQQGDGAGYDILSFDEDGRERFIEVKTTAFAKETPFFISRNEVEFSREHSVQFHLYRLFAFRRRPRMFTLQGDMHKRLILDPVSFRASVA